MANGDGGFILPKALNINALVMVISVGASFWAQWAIFKERSDNQASQIAQLNTHITFTDDRLALLKNDFVAYKTQLDDLIETMRRQRVNLTNPEYPR